MKKIDIIKKILGERYLQPPKNNFARALAPANIALVKYWGKRNQELNLPMTSSLSISLGNKGAEVSLKVTNRDYDEIFLNGHLVNAQATFADRLIQFLNLFRFSEEIALPQIKHGTRNDEFYSLPGVNSIDSSMRGANATKQSRCFSIQINSNIPIAAGLASSACGFASIIKALNNLYDWNLSSKELSILARLGSGSASRSLWDGFVEWHQGSEDHGNDSHGELIPIEWKALCVGLLIMNSAEKKISSRQAMQRTIETSKLYQVWPEKVSEDLLFIKSAIKEKNFELLGKTAESNALAMHATMLSAWPPINFSIPKTLQAMEKVWQLREGGIQIYFTQDAGPNLKLLFLEKDSSLLQSYFPSMEMVRPFNS